MGWHLEDILGARFNGHNVVEAKYGGRIVWPLGYTYVITAAALHYSSGSTILASGINYAYITGTVEVWQGSTLIRTETDVALTPVLSGQYASEFYLDGTAIKSYHRHTTPTSGFSANVSATYSGSASFALSSSVTQQANVATPHTTISDELSLAVAAYTSSSSPCPASGGTAAITSYGCTRTTTSYTSYTSGDSTTPTSVITYPTPSQSISGSGLTATTTQVEWASRGTTTANNQRHATLKIYTDYNTTGASVTLYQATNRKTESYVTTLTLAGSPSDRTGSNALSKSSHSLRLVAEDTHYQSWESGAENNITTDLVSSVVLSGSWMSIEYTEPITPGDPRIPYVVISANTAYQSRSGSVSLSGSQSKTINIEQKGETVSVAVTLTPVISQMLTTNVAAFLVSASSPDSSISSLSRLEINLFTGTDSDTLVLTNITLPYNSPSAAQLSVSGYEWNYSGIATATGTSGDRQFPAPVTLNPLGFNVTAPSQAISADGGTANVVVFAGWDGWSISSGQSWCSLSAASGNHGITTVVATLQENQTTSQRSVNITMTPPSGKGSPIVVTLSQAAGVARIAYAVNDRTSQASVDALSSDGQGMSGTAYDRSGWYLDVFIDNGDTISHTYTIGSRSVVIAGEDSDSIRLSYSEIAALSGAVDVYES